ncbi:MAG: tetratricopeptide repeat protein [Nitrospirae bacterium]|nr:tetratricopeptide repeat protein [Nitrospirota bacterium]
MNYHIRTIFNLIIFLLFITVSDSYANSLLKTGDQFLQNSNYDEAITEYKRFIFFHKEDPLASYAYYQISQAYRELNNWDEAISAINKSIYLTEDDLQKELWIIDKAVILIASSNHSLAQQELLKLYYYTEYSDVKRQSLYYLIIDFIFLHDWKSVQEYLHIYVRNYSSDETTSAIAIDHLSDEVRLFRYKSESRAKFLSTFLPGAGQIYSDNLWDGIKSLGTNVTFATISINLLQDGLYTDGAMVFLFFFSRYYMGNRYQAVQSAKKHNNDIDKKLERIYFEFLTSKFEI